MFNFSRVVWYRLDCSVAKKKRLDCSFNCAHFNRSIDMKDTIILIYVWMATNPLIFLST